MKLPFSRLAAGLVFATLVACSTSTARADLVITIEDASIIADATSVEVDVRVSGTESAGAVFPDILALFTAPFTLTPVTMGVTNLEFTDPYPDLDAVTGVESYLSNDGDYIFDGVSTNLDAPAQFAINVVATDEVSVGDTFAGFGGIEVIDTSDFLLTRLSVSLPSGLTTVDLDGEQFVLALDDLNSTFEDDLLLGLNFGPASGTITVSAVPEPSSLAILGLVTVVAWRRRRSSRHIDVVAHTP